MMTRHDYEVRLANEFNRMKTLPIKPSLYSWKPSPGQLLPSVRSYDITYRVAHYYRGSNGLLREQNEVTVRIRLPVSLQGAPSVRVIAGQFPWAINVYQNGDICIGDLYQKDRNIKHLVIKLGRLLAYDAAFTNLLSPANSAALSDWDMMQTLFYRHRYDFPALD